MEKKKLELILEAENDILHGRVLIEDNLIVESAGSLQELERKMKSLLLDFEDLEPESLMFEHRYDVSALFQRFDFLKISKVAEHAGMNPALLRQYACQAKFPSASQARKIEETLHRLAEQMKRISIHTDSVSPT